MLVSAKDMLNKAKAGKYAVGQFNINNLEWTKAVLLTAQENNSPASVISNALIWFSARSAPVQRAVPVHVPGNDPGAGSQVEALLP